MPLSIPKTQTAVFYSYTILLNNKEIGTIRSFSPSQDKTIERIREIATTSGQRVIELVPGVTDISISVERFTLYKNDFMNAVGGKINSASDAFQSLEEWVDPFDVEEVMTDPVTASERNITYKGCLISTLGKTIEVGTTYVAETATIQVAWIDTGLIG